ncbi:hypothetical protein BG004_002051, partial [Podila humilis]
MPSDSKVNTAIELVTPRAIPADITLIGTTRQMSDNNRPSSMVVPPGAYDTYTAVQQQQQVPLQEQLQLQLQLQQQQQQQQQHQQQRQQQAPDNIRATMASNRVAHTLAGPPPHQYQTHYSHHKDSSSPLPPPPPEYLHRPANGPDSVLILSQDNTLPRLPNTNTGTVATRTASTPEPTNFGHLSMTMHDRSEPVASSLSSSSGGASASASAGVAGVAGVVGATGVPAAAAAVVVGGGGGADRVHPSDHSDNSNNNPIFINGHNTMNQQQQQQQQRQYGIQSNGQASSSTTSAPPSTLPQNPNDPHIQGTTTTTATGVPQGGDDPAAAGAGEDPTRVKPRRVLGNYHMSKTLGAGSMGKVKLGVHSRTRDK